jgi:sporulation protein YlmC with PRC-barrel domain
VTEDEGHQIGYKVLRRGVPVVTSDGQELGKVAKVLDNEREHIFDGILVRTAEGRRVFVDAPEVARIAERRVTLVIPMSEAAGLPEHRGLRGAVEKRAKRRIDRMRRRLPGR